jgi:hypothetical protein
MPDDVELKVRVATKSDLDELVKLAQVSFRDDYRFPYRMEYPEDNWKWTRRQYEEYLDQPEKFTVLVVTVPMVSEGHVSEKLISLAVWDISVLEKPKGGSKLSVTCNSNAVLHI